MADISKEIQGFQTAKKGKEVRNSMVSLAQKVNKEVETNTAGVNQAITNTNAAAERANTAANSALVAGDAANTAATNADKAASNADAVKQDITRRLAEGEFKGDKGDTGKQGIQGAQGTQGEQGKQGEKGEQGEQGKQGPQGESGVMAPASGMFSLYLDTATGDLFAEYPDGSTPPSFEFDAATGELFYLTGDDVNG